MDQSFHIARIRGVELGANWSLLIIAGLITSMLAGDILPNAVPDQPSVAYWMTAAFAACLFFASLLIHEMSHALVARRHGVEVKQITLWLLGGVAKLESDSADASAELRIGGIGPVASFVVGVFLLALAIFVQASLSVGLLVAALAWVGGTNLLLAGFNMVPAFPLDGGRVLRAYLWRRSGNRVIATERAGRIGVGFAYLLMAAGVFLFLGGLTFNGLWFLFLGWFLLNAARSEVASVVEHDLLDGVHVDQIMTPGPVVVPGEISVADLIDNYVLQLHHSSYPVVDRTGAPVGLVTLDNIRPLRAEQRALTQVGEIAFGMDKVPVVNPNQEAYSLLAELARSGIGRALVVQNGLLVGVVSQSDVIKMLNIRAIARQRNVPSRHARSDDAQPTGLNTLPVR